MFLIEERTRISDLHKLRAFVENANTHFEPFIHQANILCESWFTLYRKNGPDIAPTQPPPVVYPAAGIAFKSQGIICLQVKNFPNPR
jgi:hypothetical protein